MVKMTEEPPTEETVKLRETVLKKIIDDGSTHWVLKGAVPFLAVQRTGGSADADMGRRYSRGALRRQVQVQGHFGRRPVHRRPRRAAPRPRAEAAAWRVGLHTRPDCRSSGPGIANPEEE